MDTHRQAIAFDVDMPSLIGIRKDLPGWEVEDRRGASAASLTAEVGPRPVGLLVVGARADLAESVGLCRAVRSQPGRAATPLLVLLWPEQLGLVRLLLGVGVNSCRVLPINPGVVASALARARQDNQPGRHTLNLDRPQARDRWRDDGGEG